jgi:hypothetical protein
MARTSNETTPRQFRLTESTLAELDLIGSHLEAETGVAHSRADVIRWLARREANRLEKSRRKSPDSD